MESIRRIRECYKQLRAGAGAAAAAGADLRSAEAAKPESRTPNGGTQPASVSAPPPPTHTCTHLQALQQHALVWLALKGVVHAALLLSFRA